MKFGPFWWFVNSVSLRYTDCFIYSYFKRIKLKKILFSDLKKLINNLTNLIVSKHHNLSHYDSLVYRRKSKHYFHVKIVF